MNKKVIWIGIASALLIGGGIFWWMRNKNTESSSKETDKNKDTESTSVETNKNKDSESTIKEDKNKEEVNTSKLSAEQNFKDLLKNLGNKETSKDFFTVDFNSGNSRVTFFNNNRFAIITTDTNAKIAPIKGSYSNGGKKLFVDGGKTIEGNSVWDNLLNTLKR